MGRDTHIFSSFKYASLVAIPKVQALQVIPKRLPLNGVLAESTLKTLSKGVDFRTTRHWKLQLGELKIQGQ